MTVWVFHHLNFLDFTGKSMVVPLVTAVHRLSHFYLVWVFFVPFFIIFHHLLDQTLIHLYFFLLFLFSSLILLIWTRLLFSFPYCPFFSNLLFLTLSGLLLRFVLSFFFFLNNREIFIHSAFLILFLITFITFWMIIFSTVVSRSRFSQFLPLYFLWSRFILLFIFVLFRLRFLFLKYVLIGSGLFQRFFLLLFRFYLDLFIFIGLTFLLFSLLL